MTHNDAHSGERAARRSRLEAVVDDALADATRLTFRPYGADMQGLADRIMQAADTYATSPSGSQDGAS